MAGPGSTLDRLRQQSAAPAAPVPAPPARPGTTIERLRAASSVPTEEPSTDTGLAQNFLAAAARAARPIENVTDVLTGTSPLHLGDMVKPVTTAFAPKIKEATDFARGAAKGFTESPIFRAAEWVTNRTAFAHDDPDFHIANKLNVENNRATEFGKLVGATAPEMVAWQVGSAIAQAGAVKLLRSVAPEIAQVAGPTLSKMLGGAADVERYYASVADPLAMEVAKPALVRGTEIVGRSIGSGLVGAAEAPFSPGKKPGDPPPDPLSEGLKWGLGNLAFEGVLTVGGKMLFGGAREVDKAAIAQRYLGSTAQEKLINTQTVFQKKLEDTIGAVRTALNEEKQAKILAREYNDLGGMIPVDPQAFVKGRAAALTDAAKATAERVSLTQAVHEARGNLVSIRKYAGIRMNDILAGQYLSERPTNFDGTAGQMRAWVRDKFATTDGVRKELGVVGEYSLRQLAAADITSAVRAEASDEIVLHYTASMLDRLKGQPNPRSLLKNAVHVWESPGGDAVQYLVQQGVTEATARNVMGTWEQLSEGTKRLHSIAVRMGAEPTMDFAAMGVADGHYLPHITRSGLRDDAKFKTATIKYLRGRGLSEDAATSKVLDIMEGRAAKAYQRFGSADERRAIPGTLAEKIAAGIPVIDDPIDALRVYYSGMHRRIALSQALGWKGELVQPLTAAVSREAGVGAAAVFRSNVESVAGLKYYSQLGQSFANTVTNLQTAAKMGMSWSPNMWQTALNNPITFGMRSTLAGIGEMVRNETPANLKRAAGWMASDFFDLGLRENLMQTQRQGVSSRLARLVLNGTPFNMEERYHRMGAALGAHAEMTNILQKAATGKLKGEQLVFARRLFNEAGLDLATVLREGITDGQYMTATIRLMRRSQFAVGLSGRDLRPPAWSTPMGRVITQFNTYALNQGRLMRDYVFNEVARGNYHQLHRFLGFYLPTSDVAVTIHNQLMNAVTGSKRERPKHPAARLIEDMTFAGSMGIVNNAYYAARFGLLEGVLGPTVKDLSQAANSIFHGNIDRLAEQALRMPTVLAFSNLANKAFRGGKTLARAAEEYQSAWDREEAATGVSRREGGTPLGRQLGPPAR